MWRRMAALLRQQMVENQVLTAGVWIGGLGSLGGGLYMAGCQLVDFGSRAIFSSITVRNKEDAFYWVTDWIAENSGSFVTSNRLQLRVAPSGVRGAWDIEGEFDPTAAASMQYEPGLGAHIFKYKGRVIFMRREAQDTITAGFDRQPFTPELIRLWCVGGGDALREFVNEARRAARAKETGKTSFYVPEGTSWRRVAVRDSRPWDSLVLKDALCDEILDDARDFLGSADRYRKLGVPYRRGYLLFGPPGCGKSSLVSALAGALNLHVGSLSLNTRGLDDVGLAALLRDCPAKSIILLEDIDSIFRNRGVAEGTNQSDVFLTFSGLLNAIDGVASQEGRLLIMTTNHIDRLDPALLRPGRCDMKLSLDPADEVQAARMLRRFIPSTTDTEAAAFARHAGAGTTSMAAIQAHLLKHGDIAACLANISSLESHGGASVAGANGDGIATTAAVLRMTGLKQYMWPLYAKGAMFAHQIPGVLQHEEVAVPPAHHDVLVRAAAEGVAAATRTQLSDIIRATRRDWDATRAASIAQRASGRVTADAFAAWCVAQPSADDAARNVAVLCEDPAPLPDGVWRGKPDWPVCAAVAGAHGLSHSGCAALLRETREMTREEMVTYLEGVAAA